MTRALPVAACCAAAAVALAGCAADSSTGVDPRQISVGDFAHVAPAAVAEADGGGAGAQPAAVAEIEKPAGATGRDAAAGSTVAWFEDLYVREILHPTRPGEPVIVDSLVGYVNGRPIFADAFLEPIEDHLIAVAQSSSSLAQTEGKFMEIIQGWLREVVQNELILAEAEASLSPEEQVGLIAWLRHSYEEEVRRGGGTVSGAQRRLQQSGAGLDQYLDEQKQMVLIHQIEMQKIEPRINVTWRDIEREYQRLYEDFNPPATVTLARIRLSSTGQADLIEQVKLRLAGGDSFAAIAEDLGFPDGGRWQTFELGPGGLADIEVPAVMKQALAGLRQGDTTEPFTLGSGTVWVNVVELNEPKPRSIYDPRVQLMLRNMIENRRTMAELQRFVGSLLEEGIHDDLNAMAERLYRIALLRYASR